MYLTLSPMTISSSQHSALMKLHYISHSMFDMQFGQRSKLTLRRYSRHTKLCQRHLYLNFDPKWIRTLFYLQKKMSLPYFGVHYLLNVWLFSPAPTVDVHIVRYPSMVKLASFVSIRYVVLFVYCISWCTQYGCFTLNPTKTSFFFIDACVSNGHVYMHVQFVCNACVRACFGVY